MRTPTWDAKRPLVPVDKDGNWLHYPSYEHSDWEDVKPFWAVLRVDGLRTGRSAKYLILEDTVTNKQYPMFVSDLVKGIQQGALDVDGNGGEGYLTALWTASKRGANYGIKAVA